MVRPAVGFVLFAAIAAVGLAGCLGGPTKDADAASTPTPMPTAQTARSIGDCSVETLLQWHHDPDLLPASVGGTTFDVGPDVDRLVIDGASGAYVSTGWKATITDPLDRTVFKVQGRGVTSDTAVNAGSLGGLVGRLINDLLGNDPEPVPSTVPLPSPTTPPRAAPVGHRTIEDPLAGTYSFDWETQGIVHGLGVTVTAVRCA